MLLLCNAAAALGIATIAARLTAYLIDLRKQTDDGVLGNYADGTVVPMGDLKRTTMMILSANGR